MTAEFEDPGLVIAGRRFSSRLVVGTGKYPSHEVMQAAHLAAGVDMVTVAVRRVDLSAKGAGALLNWIDRDAIFLLPNTAGCYTVEDAVRTARLGREAGLSEWVKLEVIGDERTLFPDNEALIEATAILVKEGFVVLPYTNDDPIACRKLEDAGAAAVMPLGAPIGSGLGHPESQQPADYPGTVSRADHRGRRRRHRIRCRHRHGTRGRWCLDELRDRRRGASGPHGRRHEACRDRGTPGISVRPDSKEVYASASSPSEGLSTTGSLRHAS